MTQQSYPNVQASPSIVVAALQQLRRLDGFEFWPDDLSLVNSPIFDLAHLRSHRNITDAYLLALAVHRGGKLATLDRRLSATGVSSGADHLALIS